MEIKRKPLVSIVTPVMDNLDFTKQMMTALSVCDSWPFELIIVDNASTDGTADWIRNCGLEMAGKMIYNKINNGFGKASNQGYGAAKGEYLLFLNNDIVPTQGFITAMMETILSDTKIGIVGARLAHPGKGSIQHAGVDEVDLRPNHTYFGLDMNDKRVMKQRDCMAVTGACLLISKKLFEGINGFDEAYWCGWEDVDLCNKARKQGFRVVYEPKALLYHYESRTAGRYDEDTKNSLIYMKRWVFNRDDYKVGKKGKDNKKQQKNAGIRQKFY